MVDNDPPPSYEVAMGESEEPEPLCPRHCWKLSTWTIRLLLFTGSACLVLQSLLGLGSELILQWTAQQTQKKE